jgi:hypothetical protein
MRRLTMLFSVLALTCALGLVAETVSGVPGAAAAGGYGVGPSQTGATGTARACEATAANYGWSYAQGLNCNSTANITAAITFDGMENFTYSLTGTGLRPRSTITGCYTSNQGGSGCFIAGTTDKSGNYTYSSTQPCSDYPTGYTEYDYYFGTAANGASYVSPTYTLSLVGC